jgi:uncharacterized protein YprB with RNaseH-like and TPR domain
MLRNTFCHVPGIGTRSEECLWSSGIHSWEGFAHTRRFPLSPRRVRSLTKYINQSIRHLEKSNHAYFTGLLPSNQHWRLFPEFRQSIAYLDIETTGLGGPGDHITTIALYDGKSVSWYVRGKNLEDFKQDIERYKVIVTYNGKCFDIPFIENEMRVRMDHAHIDLRYVLKSLGFTGGLKMCEKMLGIERGELEGIDGFFAVLLWNDFKENRNQKALETLLAYNIQDTVNLERLLVIAYNMKLKHTPFLNTHKLLLPETPDIPFKADTATVRRILREIHFF